MWQRIYLVSTGTTLGHIVSDGQLLAHLERGGASVVMVQPPLTRLPNRLRHQPLIDIYEALALARARRKSMHANGPGVAVYASTSATFFEPASMLTTGALRFDALALENRRGWSGALQRRLERRALRHLSVLCPMSEEQTPARQLIFEGKNVIPLPPIVEVFQHLSENERQDAVCYASNPHKKGLDIVLRAWVKAGPTTRGRRLLIAGADKEIVQNFVRQRRLTLPDNVVIVGRLDHGEFVNLLGSTHSLISASRYEDFGAVQLEALAAGAMLVTTPGDGPYEGRAAAAALGGKLLSRDNSPEALSEVVKTSFGLGREELHSLRHAALDHLSKYSETTVQGRISTELLPRLSVPATGAGQAGTEGVLRRSRMVEGSGRQVDPT